MRKCIQTRFLPLHTLEKFFLGLDSGGLEMQQNTFLTNPDIKKYLFKNLILGVWKYAQMHQNTFLTSLEVKKIIF
jgi:hypothetical protein